MPYTSKRFGEIMKNIKECRWQYYVAACGEVMVKWNGVWKPWDEVKQWDKRMVA